jgi:sulfonate transport system ATP-binding protein
MSSIARPDPLQVYDPAPRGSESHILEAAAQRNGRGAAVSVRNLGKSFGKRTVLRALSLEIARGMFVAIVGRSGCGKTTLLRIVAGLEHSDRGNLNIESGNSQLAASERPDIRFMFQEARLLPWKSVIDNVRIGMPKSALPAAMAALRDVGLEDRAADWPAALSGGQRQRVALARALMHRPQLLLLDEPLGALDALTRIEMHALIERLWRETGFTAMLVTHDVQEAVVLADRVVVVDNGGIAFDEAVNLPRPRARGSAELAALEDRILSHVLRSGSDTTSAR